MNQKIMIDLSRTPNVLFLGNGILQLAGGGNWSSLLGKLKKNPDMEVSLDGIPLAMQPECLQGTDIEEVQRISATSICECEKDPYGCLTRLVALPFDAILTTNYTYEIERELAGREWNETIRRRTFAALHGSPHVRNNTCICNMVPCRDGRTVPVFHIHGERMRKHSLVLSYYSYANAVSRMIELNKQRGNDYQNLQEAGETLECYSWLDYFIMGNVFAVGFGFNTSEFDVWWAIERKAREKAKHGLLHAYMISDRGFENAQRVLFDAMKVVNHEISVTDQYSIGYQQAIQDIGKNIG